MSNGYFCADRNSYGDISSFHTNLSKFREYDADYKLVNDDKVKEMVMQTTNYVVKFGWDRVYVSSPWNRKIRNSLNKSLS
jgi:hypothetical protein